MIGFRKTLLDIVLEASHLEHLGYVSRRRSVSVARRIAKLHAIVGQHGVDLVGYGLDQCDENVGSGVEVADRVDIELFLRGLIALHIW